MHRHRCQQMAVIATIHGAQTWVVWIVVSSKHATAFIAIKGCIMAILGHSSKSVHSAVYAP